MHVRRIPPARSLTALAVAVVAAVAALAAAPDAVPELGRLDITVRDAETGVGIPARIVVRQAARRSQRIATDAAGRLSLAARPGLYRISVRSVARGYRPIRTRLLVEVDRDLPVEVLLDSTAAKRAAPVSAARSTTHAVFTGTIVGDADLQPLAGVTVRAVRSGVESSSGPDGRFRIGVPVAPEMLSDPMAMPTTEIVVFSKPGWVTHEERGLPLVPDESQLRVTMKTGRGRSVVEPTLLQGTGGEAPDGLASDGSTSHEVSAALTTSATFINPPDTIRVGTGCSCATCPSVSVMTLETYVKGGLNNEWISSWHADSLRAGAVAFRSYGAYHVYHPRTGTFDICSTTCCQVYDSTTSTSTNNATDYTSGFMVRNGSEPAFAEYSAENNDLSGSNGCGDCYVGNNSSWSCLYDVVGCGQALFGHGRGMSQWGSQRWANNQGEDWRWIVDHYYSDRPTPKYYISSPLSITAASGTPNTVAAGQTFTVNVNGFNYAEAAHAQIMLGASLCSGSCSISDASNDAKVTAAVGAHMVSRSFTVPGGTANGTYDLLVAYWFDVDQSNTIGSGDLIVATRQETGAIVVSNATPTHTRTATATVTSTRTASVTTTATATATASTTPTTPGAPTFTRTATSAATTTSSATPTSSASATPSLTDTPVTTPTPTIAASGAVCASAPLVGCTTGGRGSLKMRDTGDPFRHQLLWKWSSGITSVVDFGDPATGDTRYRLCVYDGTNLVFGPLLEADGNWRSTSRGFKYTNLLTNADGVYKALLKEGAGNAQILIKGRGTNLGSALGLPYASGTIVTQFVRSDAAGDHCWAATFDSPLVNDGQRFKAKEP